MKISVQSQNLVDDLGMENAYRAIREAGFEAIDWNIDHAWSFKEVSNATVFKDLSIFERPLDEILAYYEKELACIRENGLSITQAHAPFNAYCDQNPAMLDYAIEIYKNVIRFCEAVDCPRLVIHGISMSQAASVDAYEADYKALNLKLYESLIPTLQEVNGVTVCLENLFGGAGNGRYRWGHCTDPDEAIELIDHLNGKAGKVCFGLCLDTGHLNLMRVNPNIYINKLAHRIVCLHMHDNFAEIDRHFMPYTGNFRWQEFLVAMKRIGYKGDLNFETFAQTAKSNLPTELAPVFLTAIHGIGEYFKGQLSD